MTRSRQSASKRASCSVGDVAAVLDGIAPPRLAQSWDNVGLLAGDRQAVCSRVLLCIDMTPEVLAEAIRERCELVFAYHPPLFRPISKLLADSDGTDGLVCRAMASGIAIYSSHTALDAAEGGTNDVLAGFCELEDVEPFEYVAGEADTCKVVTFVPADEIERVASGMFGAGGGRIGDYEQCSFRLEGQGTFRGMEGTHPVVGKQGRLERVAETRLEMVVSRDRLPEVVSELRRSHPYEEPALDVYPIEGELSKGIGRVGRLPVGQTLGRLAARLKRATKSKVAMTVGSPGTRVRRAAVCVGAAGRLPLERPRSADCDVVVTGEMRHHDALTLLRCGKTAVVLGHWESERPMLAVLAKRLRKTVKSLDVRVSRSDGGPFGMVSS